MNKVDIFLLYILQGFDVDPESIPEDMITGIFPIDLADTRFGWPKSPDGTARGYMELMVGLCLDKYNQTQASHFITSLYLCIFK